MEPGCYAVNSNDYMNKVYIYNAGFKLSDKYTVVGTKTDQTTQEVGSAVYNKDTNRIEFTPSKPLCMSLYT